MDHIYVLTDPRTGQPRYVGKTDNPKRRLAFHLRDKDVCHRTNWIKELVSLGLKPTLDIIETVAPDASWEDRERYWIAQYRLMGYNLTNSTNGGDQGPDCTGMSLRKAGQGLLNIVAALTARNKTPEMREASRQTGLRNKGRKHTPEAIEKIRQSSTGRKRSDEFKERLAERNRQRNWTPEQREAMRQAQLDLDPDKKARISQAVAESNRRRKHSSEG